MSREVFENNFKVWWVDTIADISAPTTTEIDAGTDLTSQVTADGIGFNFNNNTASVDLIDAGKIAQKPGTRGVSVTLTAVRDSETDDVWDTFDYGTEGYLVVIPFGDDSSPAADEEAYVISGAAQEPQPQQSAANTYQQSQIEIPADDWDFKAAIASGA